MDTCKAIDCDRPADRSGGARRGYCYGHYKRLRRGADMGKPIQLKAKPGTYVGLVECLEPGCHNKPMTRGKCGSHDVLRAEQQRIKHSARTPEERRARVLRKYGVTPAQYDALLDRQGGGCAICGCPQGDAGVRPHALDHDHACCGPNAACSNCVRGILCVFCNNALGGYERTGFMPPDFRAYLAATAYEAVAS